MKTLILEVQGSRDIRITGTTTAQCGTATGFVIDNRLNDSEDQWYGGVMSTGDAIKLARFILDTVTEEGNECIECRLSSCLGCSPMNEYCSICEGLNGDHYPNCTNDLSALGRLNNDGMV